MMHFRKRLGGLRHVSLFMVSAALMFGQTDWNKPFPPHHVIGNVYFIGTEALGSYLIVTPAGNILVNSDFETTVPFLKQNTEKLGFKFNDIKIVLGSHAHGDHMEADAMVKEMTGARVMAMEQDVAALRKMKPKGKEHPIDRVLHDGDEVTLGGTTMVAHLTAGHTAGCTSWTLKTTDHGKPYDVIILGSIGWNPGYVLVGNKDYPSISDDYRKSFATLRAMHVDVFLAAHGSFYDLDEKYPKFLKMDPARPETNPFIDPAGFRAHIDLKEKQFLDEYNRQKALADAKK